MAMTTGRNISAWPIEQITLEAIKPTDFVAPNFRAAELTRSDIAQRRGIGNGFETDEQLQAAVHLARHVLQPVRDAFGSYTPNSVFRSQALERALKGRPRAWVSTSQHIRGEACDIEVPGQTTLQLAKWCASQLATYDQIICECYDPRLGPNAGWVHVSLVPPWVGRPNRRKRLSYIRDPATGRMVYVDGFRATP